MQPSSIRVIRPEQFDSTTTQTPGSKRTAAIYPGAGTASPMWGGLFLVEPGREYTIMENSTRSRMS
jgi:hypothetical protein